jgi:hypothetical protein
MDMEMKKPQKAGNKSSTLFGALLGAVATVPN